MKVVKLTKTMLKLSPENLLRKLGLVDEVRKQAYPERVFMADVDYRTLERNLVARVKKEFSGLLSTKIAVRRTVGYEMLQYGPNTTLGRALKPGYVLVEELPWSEYVTSQKT